MMTAKMRHYFNCGAELGVLSRAEWSPLDDCGSPECLRAAREAYRQEREEAHEQLDKDMGYY